ncbi:MAG: restriction endonuclease subunit S, partial [Acidimicrobiia bacterium]|nr:restriction endonuclease subunit S [Acidimicrobiia bacterium]
MTWQSVPLRRLFRVVNGGTPTSDEDNWGGGIQWATPVDLGRVHGGTLDGTDRTLSSIGLRTGSAAVPAGSLVISTRAPIGYVAEATTTTAFNQGCRGLVPTTSLDSRFYRYVVVAMTDQLQAAGQGSTFVELPGDALAEQRMPMPPVRLQRAIADFLDAETARIDALITKK